MVIVNNDRQQMLKKGRVIIPECDRVEVVESIGVVDQVVLATDEDESVRRTLAQVRQMFPDDLIFANGSDRRDASLIAEADARVELDIRIVFGVGGTEKADASSRITREVESLART